MNKHLPEVSILISTKDRREDLRNLLESLDSIDYPKEKLEVVVVEETNSPMEMDGIKYIPIPQENRGFGHTRNVAVKNAAKDIVVFIDDDCVPEPQWLKELVKPFSNERILGVAGAVKVRNCNAIGLCENVLGFPGGGLKYIHQVRGKERTTLELSTLNAAYRKIEVIRAGGFDEGSQFGGEDYMLAKLICMDERCVYVPGAAVFHKVRGTLMENLKWFIRRGKSDMGVMERLEISRNHLWWILRSSVILKLLIGGTGIFLLTSNLALSILPLLLGYYAVNFFSYSYSYRYLKDVRVLFLTPVLKLIMDIGADIGRLSYLMFVKLR